MSQIWLVFFKASLLSSTDLQQKMYYPARIIFCRHQFKTKYSRLEMSEVCNGEDYIGPFPEFWLSQDLNNTLLEHFDSDQMSSKR